MDILEADLQNAIKGAKDLMAEHGCMEMTGIARKIMAKTFAPVEAFIAAGILYLFLNFLMVQFVKYLEWKYNPHLRVEQN